MRHPPLTEQKLLLLCALDAAGDMSAAQAERFLIENAIMDYFDVRLALAELSEAELIVRDGDDEAPYAVTPVGHKAAVLFKNRVPGSKLERISEAAPRWRALFDREGDMGTSVRKLAPGAYEVSMRLRERDVDLLKIKIMAADRDEAELIRGGWERRAAGIYRLLLETLARPADEE